MHSISKNLKFDSQINSSSLASLELTRRAWIEVSGKSIENNVREIKSILKSHCLFMAVVKANGYGHDARFVALNAIKGGADHLGVATLSEAIYLRSAGIDIPILILGNVYTKEELLICLQNNLMPTVSDMDVCNFCDEIGNKYKKNFYVHLKVDTGMSRLGFKIKNFINCFKKISTLENIKIDGIYSHLATADQFNSENKNSFANIQRGDFVKMLSNLSIQKYPDIKIHLANSAGIFLGDDFHFDMVRVGLSMYGYSPFKINKNLKLKPALYLKSKISFIKSVDDNVGISYGKEFITKRKTKLAVISIGYADGVNRKLSGKISLIHNGRMYPQIGTITMDQLMIDITDAKGIKVGDTVTLLGFDGEKSISAIEWAEKASTIPWEILCAFKSRLPRVKIK